MEIEKKLWSQGRGNSDYKIGAVYQLFFKVGKSVLFNSRETMGYTIGETFLIKKSEIQNAAKS